MDDAELFSATVREILRDMRDGDTLRLRGVVISRNRGGGYVMELRAHVYCTLEQIEKQMRHAHRTQDSLCDPPNGADLQWVQA